MTTISQMQGVYISETHYVTDCWVQTHKVFQLIDFLYFYLVLFIVAIAVKAFAFDNPKKYVLVF